jgi:hypothetical protein
MSNEEKTALELEREQMETAAQSENAKRSGVGTRIKVGSTRGKATQNIKYEFFDESQPDTCPKTVEQFVNITGIKANSELCELLIVGFNDKQYTEASDPIAEFVNPAWPDDVKLQFRTVVRNLAKMQNITISEASDLVKPGTEKKFLASQAK